MTRTWNKADTALLGSFLFFLLSLGLHLHFPQTLWPEGLLMVSEAALVGGVADWFAVTALFRKPLGFPYHTQAGQFYSRDCHYGAEGILLTPKAFSSHRENSSAPHAAGIFT